jgi:hypothetical protein
MLWMSSTGALATDHLQAIPLDAPRICTFLPSAGRLCGSSFASAAAKILKVRFFLNVLVSIEFVG